MGLGGTVHQRVVLCHFENSRKANQANTMNSSEPVVLQSRTVRASRAIRRQPPAAVGEALHGPLSQSRGRLDQQSHRKRRHPPAVALTELERQCRIRRVVACKAAVDRAMMLPFAGSAFARSHPQSGVGGARRRRTPRCLIKTSTLWRRPTRPPRRFGEGGGGRKSERSQGWSFPPAPGSRRGPD
jgi:hypothetical protein